jgi:hypothetical protein
MPEKWFFEFLGGSVIAYGFLFMVLNFLKKYFPGKQNSTNCPVEVSQCMKQLSDNQIKMTEILNSLKQYAVENNIKLNAIQVDVAILKDRN